MWVLQQIATPTMKSKLQDQPQQILSDSEIGHIPSQQNLPQAITYGQSPVSMRCPYCLEQIRTQIILKPQLITVALGITIFAIVPNLTMMMLVIMLLQFVASRKHRCPLCQQELGSDGRFLMVFTDQVYSMTLFSAGFIFTKKAAVTVGLILFAGSLIALRGTYEESNRAVATTWGEYLVECGENEPVHCLKKYKNKEFKNWEGHVLRLVDNRKYPHKWYMHAISLFLKMDPTMHNDTKPDVLMTLNTDIVFYNSDILKNLIHGDRIRFNCTLHDRQRGDLKDVMHMHISELQITGHDTKYAMYTSELQEEWIKIHVEDRGGLRSETGPLSSIEPI